MSFVRISKDFWVNVCTHDALLRRCFHSIYNRFPTKETRESAYNLMLICMHKSGSNYGGQVTVDVFHKFNEAEAVGYNYRMLVKQGFTKKQIEGKVARRAAKRGINVVKRFEQYMYKWVEKILYENWMKERNHTIRTMYSSSYDVPVEGSAFLTRRHAEGYSSWKDTTPGKKGHYGSTWMEKVDSKQDTHNLKAPDIHDRGDYISEHSLGYQDTTEADSLKKQITGILKSDVERKVVQLRIEDLNGKDIANTLGITSQYVSLLLKSIHQRCVENGLITA